MVYPQLSTVTELLKPVTWFPPMWAFACGVIASGQNLGDNWSLILLGLILTGPLVCASSQAVNDWFDRHVDAINEPHRPIPSGRMPGYWGLAIAIFWSLVSLIWAWSLGAWGFWACALAIALSWAYSMPPVRLKQNGWLGNAACGLSYEGLAWITGGAVMLSGDLPVEKSLIVALLYSLGAHGIMTLNDFKAVKGDAQMGIRSLPVQLGIVKAAYVACVFIVAAQLVVAGLLFSWGQPLHGVTLLLLCVAQLPLMQKFIQTPVEKALMLSAFGVPLYVAGMMVTAWSLHYLADTK
jgi:chlorophyll synthase